jgi:hypothetical protein
MFSSRKKKHSPSNSAPANGLASQTQQSPPLYPWSAHSPPSGQWPSPFPRRFYALSTTATATAGELFLFGGQTHDRSTHNDLYVISIRDFSTTLLQTSGYALQFLMVVNRNGARDVKTKRLGDEAAPDVARLSVARVSPGR